MFKGPRLQLGKYSLLEQVLMMLHGKGAYNSMPSAHYRCSRLYTIIVAATGREGKAKSDQWIGKASSYKTRNHC